MKAPKQEAFTNICDKGSDLLKELFELTKGDVNKRILIVDDQPSILQLLQISLENMGYDPVTCPNVKHAMAIADQMQPHTIILDLNGVGDITEFVQKHGAKTILFSGAGSMALARIKPKVYNVCDKLHMAKLLKMVKVRAALAG